MSKCKNPTHILLLKMMDDLHDHYEVLVSDELGRVITLGATPEDSMLAAAKVTALLCASLVSTSLTLRDRGKKPKVTDDDRIEDMMDTTLDLMVTAIGFVEQIDIEYGLASSKKSKKQSDDDKKPKFHTVH